MNLIQIENRVGKVRLNDAVTPWSANELIEDLEKLYGAKALCDPRMSGMVMASDQDALEEVAFEVNSPGGAVLDGYRIFHAISGMRERGVRVVATVNGVAASMASVVIMAADERRITSGSRIMIHEASQQVAGDAEDHARAAKILDEMSEEIAKIYAGVTGESAESMRGLMKKETWMGAEESVKRGFIDSIVTPNTLLDKEVNKRHAQQSKIMSFLDRFNPDAALVAKVETLEADHSALTAEVEEAKSYVTEAAQEIENLKTQLSEAQSLLETEKEAGAQVRADLEAEKLKTTPDEISKLVTAELATAGHPPIEEKPDESPKSLKEQYNSLTDPAARKEFRAKHWEALNQN